MRWQRANEVHSAESAIIISYPISASGIIVSLKTPTKYREFFPTLFVKATSTVDIFGEHGMMARIPWLLRQSELQNCIILSIDSVLIKIKITRYFCIAEILSQRKHSHWLPWDHMTIYNKTVSRQKLYFAGNIASKGKRAIFPANVEIYFFQCLVPQRQLVYYCIKTTLLHLHSLSMSHKAKLYLQSFQVLEPMKYITMKLVDLVIVQKPYKKYIGTMKELKSWRSECYHLVGGY